MKLSDDPTTIEKFFYGSATISERGQIVIPADARKECEMAPGDKLLIFRHPLHPQMLILARVADMQQLHIQMQNAIEALTEQLHGEDPPHAVDDEDEGDIHA